MNDQLERNFNYDDGNDAMVAEAQDHLRRAVGNLGRAVEAARHEQHDGQAEALDAIRRELEAQADLLGRMMALKD